MEKIMCAFAMRRCAVAVVHVNMSSRVGLNPYLDRPAEAGCRSAPEICDFGARSPRTRERTRAESIARRKEDVGETNQGFFAGKHMKNTSTFGSFGALLEVSTPPGPTPHRTHWESPTALRPDETRGPTRHAPPRFGRPHPRHCGPRRACKQEIELSIASLP